VTADQSRCAELLVEATPDAAIVSNLGTASYHLIDVEDRPRNFYLTGAMGSTTALGLGLALAIDEQVTVLEGDGSLLMSLGTLATVSRAGPHNLTVVVMDNGSFQTTGGQPTLSETADFVDVAKACGLAAWAVETTGEFSAAYSAAVAHDGPSLVACTVESTSPVDHPPLDDAHAFNKWRFRREFVQE
jgi:thiamine pyrophosphate-dependent acetolactate synthase large subunit-like protein